MRPVRNERGVTLMESMVAAALVATVTYYLVTSVTNTFSQSGQLNDRLIANQVVQERISKMKNLSGYYVPVVDSGNLPGYFVSCYSKRGVAMKTTSGTEGETIVFGKALGQPSGLCEKADFEVQFQSDASDLSLLHAHVLFKQNAAKNIRNDHREMRLERIL